MEFIHSERRLRCCARTDFSLRCFALTFFLFIGAALTGTLRFWHCRLVSCFCFFFLLCWFWSRGWQGWWWVLCFFFKQKTAYEVRRHRELGEIAYVAQRKREAIAFNREDYFRFAGLCVKRFIYYWAGRPRPAQISALPPIENLVFLASSVLALWGLARALRKRRPSAWLFFWLILCYPLVYYVTFPHARYRHPIEPELTILIVYVISEAERKGNRLKEIPA